MVGGFGQLPRVGGCKGCFHPGELSPPVDQHKPAQAMSVISHLFLPLGKELMLGLCRPLHLYEIGKWNFYISNSIALSLTVLSVLNSTWLAATARWKCYRWNSFGIGESLLLGQCFSNGGTRTTVGRLRLKCEDRRRNQISSFGETDESI